jgi:hypothetical protein
MRYVALAGLRLDLLVASNGVHMRFGGGGEFIAIPFAPNGTLDGVGMELHFGLQVADKLEASTATVGINLAAAYFLWRLLALRRQARSASVGMSSASAPAT